MSKNKDVVFSYHSKKRRLRVFINGILKHEHLGEKAKRLFELIIKD